MAPRRAFPRLCPAVRGGFWLLWFSKIPSLSNFPPAREITRRPIALRSISPKNPRLGASRFAVWLAACCCATAFFMHFPPGTVARSTLAISASTRREQDGRARITAPAFYAFALVVLAVLHVPYFRSIRPRRFTPAMASLVRCIAPPMIGYSFEIALRRKPPICARRNND